MGPTAFDTFLEIVGMGTLIAGVLWLFVYLISMPQEHYLDGMAFKTCHPYSVAIRFEDLKHNIVICRSNNGLIVREILGDFRDKD